LSEGDAFVDEDQGQKVESSHTNSLVHDESGVFSKTSSSSYGSVSSSNGHPANKKPDNKIINSSANSNSCGRNVQAAKLLNGLSSELPTDYNTESYCNDVIPNGHLGSSFDNESSEAVVDNVESSVTSSQALLKPDHSTELRQVYEFYEERFKRVLLRITDLLCDELLPDTLIDYLRETRPECLTSPDDEVMSRLPRASELREMLWDVLTCQGLESFEAFCDTLRMNGDQQGHLANIIENVDYLLALVAPIVHRDEDDWAASAYCVECGCREKKDKSSDTTDAPPSESTDFDVEIIYCDKETTNFAGGRSPAPQHHDEAVISLSTSSYCDSIVTSSEPLLRSGCSATACVMCTGWNV